MAIYFVLKITAQIIRTYLLWVKIKSKETEVCVLQKVERLKISPTSPFNSVKPILITPCWSVTSVSKKSSHVCYCSSSKCVTFFLKQTLLDFWKINLEKSSSTKWIFSLFETEFLLPVKLAKINFKMDFFQAKNPVRQTWVFQLDFSKFKYRSTGGVRP